jgi:hypothetical protein
MWGAIYSYLLLLGPCISFLSDADILPLAKDATGI